MHFSGTLSICNCLDPLTLSVVKGVQIKSCLSTTMLCLSQSTHFWDSLYIFSLYKHHISCYRKEQTWSENYSFWILLLLRLLPPGEGMKYNKLNDECGSQTQWRDAGMFSMSDTCDQCDQWPGVRSVPLQYSQHRVTISELQQCRGSNPFNKLNFVNYWWKVDGC